MISSGDYNIGNSQLKTSAIKTNTLFGINLPNYLIKNILQYVPKTISQPKTFKCSFCKAHERYVSFACFKCYSKNCPRINKLKTQVIEICSYCEILISASMRLIHRMEDIEDCMQLPPLITIKKSGRIIVSDNAEMLRMNVRDKYDAVTLTTLTTMTNYFNGLETLEVVENMVDQDVCNYNSYISDLEKRHIYCHYDF